MPNLLPEILAPLALLAQDAPATPPAAQGQGGFLESLLSGMFVPLILCFVIFWLLILRPESKQRKKRAEMLGNLKKGDKVITNGGLHGVVVQVQDGIATLLVDEGVRLRFSVAAIQQVGDEVVAEPRK